MNSVLNGAIFNTTETSANGVTVPESRDTGLISGSLLAISSLVISGVLCTLFGTMGAFTNSVNLAVYIRQGLTEGTSVPLTALAFSDLFVSLFSIALGLCTLFNYIALGQGVVNWMNLLEVAFGWPRGMVVDISMGITVFVSAERAICVTWPLKVSSIVTKRRSIGIILAIYVCIAACYLPNYLTAGLSWQTVPTEGAENETTSYKTSLRVWRSSNRDSVDRATNIYNTSLRFVCYAMVIFFLIVMVSGLRKASSFRDKSSSGAAGGGKNVDGTEPAAPGGGGSTLNTRDRKAVLMVSIVTAMFIVCTLPIIFVILWKFLDHDLILGGKEENLLWFLFSIVYLAESISSSCNIFVYLGISTRFRHTFYTLFGCNYGVKNSGK